MRFRQWSTCAAFVCVAIAIQTAIAALAVDDEPRSADRNSTPSLTSSEQEQSGESPPAAYTTERLRGKVVWMAEALDRLFGVRADADSAESLVALETAEGELHPLVKDFRGRAFHLDARLRDTEMELMVRRFAGSPMVQVVRVYSIKDGRRYELDYWCDICAIPMYELKACECCQGPTRIRERLVEDDRASEQEQPATER